MVNAVSTAAAPQTALPDNPALDKSAKEFEGMFLSEMLSHMFEGIQTDPVFGGGKGEDIWRGMMVQEYGKMISAHGGLGLSREIKSMMLRMQQEGKAP